MARFLIAEDDPEARALLEDVLINSGHEVCATIDGRDALRKLSEFTPDIVILDNDMPRMSGIEVVRAIKGDPKTRFTPTILLTAKSSHEDIVVGLESGADDYIVKPFKRQELLARAAAALRLKETYLGYQRESEALDQLKAVVSKKFSCGSLLGGSSAMQEIYRIIEKFQRSALPVLIQGESGTGKELVARAIHIGSSRNSGQFIAYNCATFSEGITESELFGHVKGAFTGAVKDSVGIFEAANNGTLFLDEIGELNINLQAKLLRAIQEGVVVPVGSTKPRKVDVRIIAATHRDIEKMISEGRFREDLFYRLSVLPLSLPALREREGDVELLIQNFLREISDREKLPIKKVPESLMRRLASYRWPGNVRELRNEIERIALLSGDSPFLLEDYLSQKILGNADTSVASPTSDNLDLHAAVAAVEKRYITKALHLTNGNKSEAARLLGVSRSNLIEKVKIYGL